jgi:hypothetical protein
MGLVKDMIFQIMNYMSSSFMIWFLQSIDHEFDDDQRFALGPWR